eukprot:SAG25_NODE_14391_length_255_cov_0.987179_1_plen_55_part_10
MTTCDQSSPQETTFSDLWGAKVIMDTGDHYRLPGAGCEWIDNDGKCHNIPPQSSS